MHNISKYTPALNQLCRDGVSVVQLRNTMKQTYHKDVSNNPKLKAGLPNGQSDL